MLNAKDLILVLYQQISMWREYSTVSTYPAHSVWRRCIDDIMRIVQNAELDTALSSSGIPVDDVLEGM